MAFGLLLCLVVALEFVPLLLFLALPLSWIDHRFLRVALGREDEREHCR